MSELLDELAAAVQGLEPDRVAGVDAARLVTLFERGERLCAAGKTLMAARAVDCRQWAGKGARSPQEWLSEISGVPVGTAQRTLLTAEQVTARPELADAMRSGELSSAQAAEISSAVAENPDATRRLLDDAKENGFKGLKKACRAAKLAAARSPEDDEAIARRQREARYCRTWIEPDGMGRIDARLDPVSFTRFTSFFHPFQEEAFDAARKAGAREPVDRYRADALVAMAEATAATEGSREAATGAKTRNRLPSEAIVIVDRGALLRGYPVDGERCEIEGFGPVPVAVAREIMEDSFLAAVVTDGVDIRRVVHLGRHPTRMQKTALAVRDPACMVPRCGRTDRLEAHHTPAFEESHHTTLDELVRTCEGHHDQITHQGGILSGEPGNWSWQPPSPHGPFEGPPEGMDPCAGPFDDPPSDVRGIDEAGGPAP